MPEKIKNILARVSEYESLELFKLNHPFEYEELEKSGYLKKAKLVIKKQGHRTITEIVEVAEKYTDRTLWVIENYKDYQKLKRIGKLCLVKFLKTDNNYYKPLEECLRLARLSKCKGVLQAADYAAFTILKNQNLLNSVFEPDLDPEANIHVRDHETDTKGWKQWSMKDIARAEIEKRRNSWYFKRATKEEQEQIINRIIRNYEQGEKL